MIGKEIKTFKQFMLDLAPDARTEVFQQIVKHCHVTATCVRLWERNVASPQEWRIKVINKIAKRHGCTINFAPIKRKQHLECADPTPLPDNQPAQTAEQPAQHDEQIQQPTLTTQGGAL